MEIDECLPRPCENGGTCTDLVNGYHCDCLTDFEVWYMENTSICTLIFVNALSMQSIITTAYTCSRVSTVMLT